MGTLPQQSACYFADNLDEVAVGAVVKEAGMKAWLCCPAPEAHPEVSCVLIASPSCATLHVVSP